MSHIPLPKPRSAELETFIHRKVKEREKNTALKTTKLVDKCPMKIKVSLLIPYQREYSTAWLNTADQVSSSVSTKQLGRLLYGEQNGDK